MLSLLEGLKLTLFIFLKKNCAHLMVHVYNLQYTSVSSAKYQLSSSPSSMSKILNTVDADHMKGDHLLKLTVKKAKKSPCP